MKKIESAANPRFKILRQLVDSSRERKKALADIFWALLNSAEFRLNH